MKKLLLLSALAFSAIASQAVTFNVTIAGQEVQPGSTVTSNHLTVEYFEEEYKGQIISTTSYVLDPEIFATASEPTDATVTVTLNSFNFPALAPNLQFCWPNNCYDLEPGTPQESKGRLNSTPSDLAFHALWNDYTIDEPFTYSCSVQIVSQTNPSDSFSFNFDLSYDPAQLNGVDGVEADDDVPTVYYDLAGRRVLNPQKGQLVIERKGSKASKVIL